MSFILDALKKSDQARQRGKTPRLPAVVHEPQVGKPKRRVRWQHILAFALLLNAALFMWWLLPWKPGGEAGTATRKPAASPQPVQMAKETGKTPPAAMAERTEESAPQASEGGKPGAKGPDLQAALPTSPDPIEKQGAPVSSTEQTDAVKGEVPKTEAPIGPPPQASHEAAPIAGATPAPGARGKRVPARPAPDSTGAPASNVPKKPPPAAATAATEASGTPEPSVAENSKKTAAKPPAAPDGRKRTPGAAAQKGQPAGSKELLSDLKSLTGEVETSPGKAAASRAVLNFHELPSQVRSAVPKMSVSMLVYSKKPDDRWVNINGSKMREGQEVSAGLKVEEITSEGAIFSYQGHRFYKAVIGD